MNKVYQRIDDPRRGDCFKCTICTLFGFDYDEIPNFVEFDDEWLTMAIDVVKERGYKMTGMELFNPNVMYLESPTANVWENKEPYWPKTLNAIEPGMGVNGLFLASVYSPKYTSASEHPIDHLHSVICDINCNIVFDPQKEYESVVNYPYAKLIGYNGIRSIDIIRKL